MDPKREGGADFEFERRLPHTVGSAGEKTYPADKIRKILLNWLLDVNHKFLKRDEPDMEPFAFFAAALIFDRWFLRARRVVDVKKVQCHGVAAYFLAMSMYDIETATPIKDLTWVTDGACTSSELEETIMEMYRLTDFRAPWRNEALMVWEMFAKEDVVPTGWIQEGWKDLAKRRVEEWETSPADLASSVKPSDGDDSDSDSDADGAWSPGPRAQKSGEKYSAEVQVAKANR